MNSTAKKYLLISLLSVVMLFVTGLTAIFVIPGTKSGDFIFNSIILLFVLANFISTVVCTGIIVSKLEEKNNKDEKEDGK